MLMKYKDFKQMSTKDMMQVQGGRMKEIKPCVKCKSEDGGVNDTCSTGKTCLYGSVACNQNSDGTCAS